VCTGLCFIHWFSDATREGKGEQSTLYASEGSSARMASVRTHARTHARTHVRTRARNPFKDENKSRRKDKQRGRERERERDPSVYLPSSAHPLPFDKDFNLARLRDDYERERGTEDGNRLSPPFASLANCFVISLREFYFALHVIDTHRHRDMRLPARDLRLGGKERVEFWWPIIPILFVQYRGPSSTTICQV